MPSTGSKASGGAPDGDVPGVEESDEALQLISRLLIKRAVDSKNRLTPEAQIQVDLRKDPNRQKFLERLVDELVPEGVSTSIWMRWLNGEDPPFLSNGLKKPVKLSHGAGKNLKRGPASLAPYYDRVERAREDLAVAEDQLAYQRAFDRSQLEYAVTDHLVRLVAPIFAMGPAWTMMRSISGHASEQLLERATKLVDGQEKQKIAEKFKTDRQKETDEILEAMDFFSGHEPFENQVRAAILQVVRNSGFMRTQLEQSGRKPRSEAKRSSDAHPKATADAKQVLEGLQRKDEAD